MNQFLRLHSRILSLLFLLVIACAFGLPGCREGSGGEPPINLDSVLPHVMSVAAAAQFTASFRAQADSLAVKCPTFKDSLQLGFSEAFNSDSYRLLLMQKDSTGAPAAGVRIYYGRGKDGQVKLILVPYDRNGADILNRLISKDEKQVPGVSTAHTESLSVDGAQVIEQGQHCPPICAPPNALNQ
jgi:hypothetical protein